MSCFGTFIQLPVVVFFPNNHYTHTTSRRSMAIKYRHNSVNVIDLYCLGIMYIKLCSKINLAQNVTPLYLISRVSEFCKIHVITAAFYEEVNPLSCVTVNYFLILAWTQQSLMSLQVPLQLRFSTDGSEIVFKIIVYTLFNYFILMFHYIYWVFFTFLILSLCWKSLFVECKLSFLCYMFGCGRGLWNKVTG